MKKVILLALFISLWVSLATNEKEAIAANKIIKDPVIEEAIKKELELDSSYEITKSDLERLTQLWIEGNAQSLEGLEYAVNLKSLAINYAHISDVSALAPLHKLYDVYIHHTQVKDISPLAGKTSIEWLILDSNEIEDIKPLATLENLRSLTIEDNHITDLTPLENLKQLYLISIKYNPIKSLETLPRMPHLQAVYMVGVEADDWDKLLDIQKLRYVQWSKERTEQQANLAARLIEKEVEVVEESKPRPIRVIINNQEIPPISVSTKNGSTFIQLRKISDVLDLNIEWKESTRSIIITKDKNQLEFTVDSKSAYINNKLVELNEPPFIDEMYQQAFVPIRFLFEALNASIQWNHERNLINVTY
ncbi:hypothetical protein YDYSG_55060 [Paenibacillus tyrfis]|uniref:stalk domain-containing protein n=1 Tax=Paenibacillus tyrfis TaxID=1501230 RepID=UPI002493C9D5|nr:stalk domain-containing protein [Paenibacillus tyrfis]GLI09474.1 hypothetical protein YDYSG_55060 [Paenibacillus tyrfis]